MVEKGTRFAGVTRPNTVTTRKIDNCQIGVSLPHATGTGRALIDPEPYLPRARTDDRERSRAAGIDDHAPVVATKPQLARCMGPGPRAPSPGRRRAGGLSVGGRGLRAGHTLALPREPHGQVKHNPVEKGDLASTQLPVEVRSTRWSSV